MAKWVFLFCVFAVSGISSIAQRRVDEDTVKLSFGWIGGRSGDTNFLYMGLQPTVGPASDSDFRRFFNKYLRSQYHGDTMVSGTAVAWFVIDREGRCTASYYDTAASEPEVAQEVLRVISKISICVRAGRPAAACRSQTGYSSGWLSS